MLTAGWLAVRDCDYYRLSELVAAASRRCDMTDPSGAVMLLAEAKAILERVGKQLESKSS